MAAVQMRRRVSERGVGSDLDEKTKNCCGGVTCGHVPYSNLWRLRSPLILSPHHIFASHIFPSSWPFHAYPSSGQDHKVILQNLASLMYVSPINHSPLMLMSHAQKGTTVSPIEVWASEQWARGWWWWRAVPTTRCVTVTAMTNNDN